MHTTENLHTRDSAITFHHHHLFQSQFYLHWSWDFVVLSHIPIILLQMGCSTSQPWRPMWAVSIKEKWHIALTCTWADSSLHNMNKITVTNRDRDWTNILHV